MSSASDALNLAWQYHRAGDLAHAEQVYRHVLQTEPNRSDVWCWLGAALEGQGRLDEAVACRRQAVQLRPDWAEAHNSLANALKARGHLADALATYREALRLQPESPDLHYNLGLALKQQGQLGDAVASYREALRLRPEFAEAWNNLGTVRAAQGQADEAQDCFQQALRCDPAHAPACNNLGKLHQEQGRLDDAEACFRHALQLRPQYAEAHYNLGVVLQEYRRLDDAVVHFRAAVQYRPGFAEAYANLGNVERDLGQLDEAQASLEQALRLQPDFAEARANLGYLFKARGLVAEAEQHFREAFRLRPENRLLVEAATLLPPVYQSCDDLAAWRTRLANNLRQLHADGVRLDLTREAAPTLFFLAYQGENDRDLQRTFADLCLPPTDPLLEPAVGSTVRLGFLSSHFRNHTIGRLNQGLIATLSRERFTVVVLSLGRHEDETARFIRQHADEYIELPANLPVARQRIAAQRLDVLVYADVGLDPVTSSLAHSRLAPVQCVTWGHPVTTGIPALDYFLSSALLEGDRADDHYTEKLVRLKRLPVCYARPTLPTPLRPRGHFGLPETGALYACPQSLFKLHPDFDAVLGGILRRDPHGCVALLQGWDRQWSVLLTQRFQKTIPDVTARIHFVPPQSRADFLHLNAIADVLLDPLHFGGGNTSYEALALGVPIVTLPSPYLRGRITFALYQQMQVLDGVVGSVDAYVEQAVRLGTDADYRAVVRDKIRAASDVLFDNVAGVRELEEFFLIVAGRGRQ